MSQTYRNLTGGADSDENPIIHSWDGAAQPGSEPDKMSEVKNRELLDQKLADSLRKRRVHRIMLICVVVQFISITLFVITGSVCAGVTNSGYHCFPHLGLWFAAPCYAAAALGIVALRSNLTRLVIANFVMSVICAVACGVIVIPSLFLIPNTLDQHKYACDHYYVAESESEKDQCAERKAYLRSVITTLFFDFFFAAAAMISFIVYASYICYHWNREGICCHSGNNDGPSSVRIVASDGTQIKTDPHAELVMVPKSMLEKHGIKTLSSS